MNNISTNLEIGHQVNFQLNSINPQTHTKTGIVQLQGTVIDIFENPGQIQFFNPIRVYSPMLKKLSLGIDYDTCEVYLKPEDVSTIG